MGSCLSMAVEQVLTSEVKRHSKGHITCYVITTSCFTNPCFSLRPETEIRLRLLEFAGSFMDLPSGVVAPVSRAQVGTSTPGKPIQEPVVTVHSAVHGPGCSSRATRGRQVP